MLYIKLINLYTLYFIIESWIKKVIQNVIMRLAITFLFVVDFQQIELRILAHLSNEPIMLELINHPKSTDVFTDLTSQW